MPSSSLKIEALGSYETSVDIYQSTCPNISKDTTFVIILAVECAMTSVAGDSKKLHVNLNGYKHGVTILSIVYGLRFIKRVSEIVSLSVIRDILSSVPYGKLVPIKDTNSL